MEAQHANDSLHPIGDQREKTLVDYWNTLIKRWKIVVLVFVVIVVSSLVYFKIFLTGVSFPFIAIIEIGGTDGQRLEEAAAAVSKVKAAYIPIAIIEHARQHNYSDQRYTIDVESLEGSNVIRLRGVGAEGDTENILSIENTITSRFLDDHTQRMVVLRKELEEAKFNLVLELQQLKDQEKFFPTQLQHIKDSSKVLERQIAVLKDFITQSERNRAIVLVSEAKREPANESLAATLLLMDNDIQKNRDRLFSLEEQLHRGVKEQQDQVQKEVDDNKRQQVAKQRAIEDTQFRIDYMRETKVLFPPTRLIRIPSKSIVQWLQFMGLLGVFLGVVVAFFVEFAIQARREMDRVR